MSIILKGQEENETNEIHLFTYFTLYFYKQAKTILIIQTQPQ